MKRHILFVDDEPSILQAMKRVIRPLRETLAASFAQGEKEALAMMGRQEFDIVISDMRMPGMDGAQFLHEVKVQHPETLRMVLSGQSEEEMTLRSLDCAHQYLSKPCDSETLKRTIDRACAMQDVLANVKLREIVSGMSNIPSVPTLYSQLVDELNKEEASLERVGDIIAQDAAACAKILQVVNSAFFGLARTLGNPTEAVNYLGFDTIKTLVLVAKIVEAFPVEKNLSFSIASHWNHSLIVGTLARSLAKAENQEKLIVDQSMTAGLLHDLGKLIVAYYFPEKYSQVQDTCLAEHVTESDAENEIIGSTHARIGGYLLGTWGLPPDLVEAVLFHHDPQNNPGEVFSVLTAVHSADALVYEIEQGNSNEPSLANEVYLKSIGMLEHWDQWKKMAQDHCLPKIAAS